MVWTMRARLEKIGSIGAVVAAAACPVCFPKLALLGALFGLGTFGAYESRFFIAAQVMVVLAVAGHVLSYLRHGNRWLLGSAILSGLAVFAGLHWLGSEPVAYLGFAGLVVTSATDFWTRFRRRPSTALLASVITCPKCGASRKESMQAASAI
jgi:mercuric ion transport protein